MNFIVLHTLILPPLGGNNEKSPHFFTLGFVNASAAIALHASRPIVSEIYHLQASSAEANSASALATVAFASVGTTLKPTLTQVSSATLL
jgi:hypothetical protein